MDPHHFDELAEGYDEARPLHAGCFAAALDRLAAIVPPEQHPELIEPGIGTGRVAIPLAARGYRVTGVDTSAGMLAVLERRLDELESAGEARPAVTAVRADATALPFADASFDVAVAVNLFYCVRPWKAAADELLRVVRRGGAIVIMHTGAGRSVPAVDARYRELAAELCSTISAEGAESDEQVAEYLASRGCDVRWERGDWTWTGCVSLERALDGLRERRWGFTLQTPDDVHARILGRLEGELSASSGDLGEEIEVEDELYFALATVG